MHCLAWGMATVGACQSPECPKGTEGKKGRLLLSRESGELGPTFPKFEKSPTPASLPASPTSCLLPGHRGQGREANGASTCSLGEGLDPGGKGDAGEGSVTGVVAQTHLASPSLPPSPGIASHLPNSSKGTSDIETLLVPTG